MYSSKYCLQTDGDSYRVSSQTTDNLNNPLSDDDGLQCVTPKIQNLQEPEFQSSGQHKVKLL